MHPTAHPRGEPVVHAVLAATIETLATVGYARLGVEEVAARAGVARTTVYRRWPTKAALVKAAIEALPGAEPDLPAATTVAATLEAFATRVARFVETPHGLAILRLFVEHGDGDELGALLIEIRAIRDAALVTALERLGLDPVDVAMLRELLPAALLHRALVARAPLSAAYLAQLADFLARAVRSEPRVRPPEPPEPRC